jgi:short-subunit dehydrogenase
VRPPEGSFGPWALIAGGSEGVGASFAHQLASRGVNVALVARTAGPLEKTAREIRAGHGVEVRTLALDLTVDEVVDCIDALCSDLDVATLICNAGAAHGVGALLDQPVDKALHLVRLNCISPMRLVHHYGRRMLARGGGNIILIGSGAGTAGGAGVAAYSASKSFVTTLAEGLWYELAPKNIRVLGLVLGLTRTPAMERAGFRPGGGYTADDPDVVAATGLAQIGNGPVYVMPSLQPHLEAAAKLSRAERVKAMSEATLALLDDGGVNGSTRR